MKALAGTFNQEKALVGAFYVIVKTDGSLAALHSSRRTQRLTTPRARSVLLG